MSDLGITLRGIEGRPFEFVLAEEYEPLEVVDVESDTMGDEPVWVVTLKRIAPDIPLLVKQEAEAK